MHPGGQAGAGGEGRTEGAWRWDVACCCGLALFNRAHHQKCIEGLQGF